MATTRMRLKCASHFPGTGGRVVDPVSPHHDGTQTEHGFASLFQAPGAGLGMVWIDGRATRPREGNRGHEFASFYLR